MVTLVPYTDADFEAMNRYFPQKEIHKYTNRGGGTQYSHYQAFTSPISCY